MMQSTGGATLGCGLCEREGKGNEGGCTHTAFAVASPPKCIACIVECPVLLLTFRSFLCRVHSCAACPCIRGTAPRSAREYSFVRRDRGDTGDMQHTRVHRTAGHAVEWVNVCVCINRHDWFDVCVFLCMSDVRCRWHSALSPPVNPRQPLCTRVFVCAPGMHVDVHRLTISCAC